MYTDDLPPSVEQTSNLSDNDFSISNDSSSSSFNATAPTSSNSTEPEITNLSDTLNDLNFANDNLTIANRLFDNIFDSYLLGVIFENYRMAKTNSVKILDNSQITLEKTNTSLKPEPHPTKPNRANKKRDNTNVDILGNSLASIRKIECVCPHCNRNLAASRLAPHLEKCMGMGRNASRVASKRIALFTKNSNGTSSD